jgi:hypothetical protein
LVRKLFLTPPTLPETEQCRSLNIPSSKEWLGIFNNALLLTSQAFNYEQVNDTDLTAEETAELCFGIYTAWLSSTCSAGALCEFPADPRFGLEINVRLIRRGAGGYTEELVDGEWIAPTGEYEVPAVPARTEPTSDERKCLAAANAAHVLDVTYEEATDAWTAEHTELALWGAVLDSLIALVGAFAGPTAVAYATYAKSVTDIFVEGFDAIAADVWTPAFTDELTCIFYQNATDTAGVITFDFEAINDALLEMQGAAIFAFDENRALLASQVAYLLSVVAAGGLDHAGTTTAITSYDCTPCDDWCYRWDFPASSGGWINHGGTPVTTYVAGQGWLGGIQNDGCANHVYNRLERTWGASVTNLASIVSGTYPAGASANVRFYNGATLLSSQAMTFSSGVMTWSGTPVAHTRFVIDVQKCNQPGNYYNRYIQMGGIGTSPMGSSNC